MERIKDTAICFGLFSALVVAYWASSLWPEIIGEDTNDKTTF